MTDSIRSRARQLCRNALARGEPLGWFDPLYLAAAGDPSTIPWADLVPNPHLVTWQTAGGCDLRGKRCLKVGCGLGDDCEYLASAGGVVTGFDISPAAIQWCRKRFPNSAAEYTVQDLLSPPPAWRRRYDFVLESYTLQVLPPELRPRAMSCIADFVRPGATLLVICRARSDNAPIDHMPWPLSERELLAFVDAGLKLVELVDFIDEESPPVRRFRAEFMRA